MYYTFFITQILWILSLSNIKALDKNGVTLQHNTKVSENQLAAQILAILDHYKQPDPIGVPGAPIPDPMIVPDIRKSIGIGTLSMRNILAHGLSKFRIKHVRSDLQNLKVSTGIQLDAMNVKGNYTLNSFLSKADGPFKVILKNVLVIGNATLAVERNGKLRTQDIQIDISFSDMSTDFQNLGFLGNMFQALVNSAPNLVFDAIKPLMLSEAYTKIRGEIDSNIDNMVRNYSFPNSISPLDMAISEARRRVRSLGYDPFRIADYNRTVGIFSAQMRNTWIIGISSFYRVGNISISMIDNAVSARLQIGTQKLSGTTQWEISFGNDIITRVGHAQFTIQHIKATIEISQPLDTRKHPQMLDLQLELGNLQIRCDGAGALDYLLEFSVNILPNLLRYQIMDAIENPIKIRIQEQLNQINVEKAIKDHLEIFEKEGFEGLDFNFNF